MGSGAVRLIRKASGRRIKHSFIGELLNSL
jgi:hypothetical protein